MSRDLLIHVVVLRPTLGAVVGVGSRFFEAGDVLAGQLVKHPVNASRKLILTTSEGTFTFNQEDVMELGETEAIGQARLQSEPDTLFAPNARVQRERCNLERLRVPAERLLPVSEKQS